MTQEQRRAYQAERYRARKAGKLALREEKQKPAEMACLSCEEVKPFTDEHFYVGKEQRWGLRKKCKVCRRSEVLARRYGITVEEYKAHTTGSCAICQAEGELYMDHCHTSGNAREGLCKRCNFGLGWFSDDPDRLRKAALYVEKHSLFA